jgi:hypothetical protein
MALLDDPLAGRALKFYVLLTEMPDLTVALGLSPEQLFWSRYYWFLRFTKLREASVGRDVGLEQQAFQILEYPHPDCSPDWTVIGEIETAVTRDVALRLRRMLEDGR